LVSVKAPGFNYLLAFELYCYFADLSVVIIIAGGCFRVVQFVVAIREVIMATYLEKIITPVEKQLSDESKIWSKWFALAEEKTGVKRLHLFYGKFDCK